MSKLGFTHGSIKPGDRIAGIDINNTILLDERQWLDAWAHPSVWKRALKNAAIKPLKIIYAPVDVLRYHETILVPSADPDL